MHTHATSNVATHRPHPHHHSAQHARSEACLRCAETNRAPGVDVCLTQIDLGTGNNNKINWAMNDKQEFIDVCEVVFRGARKGRGLVVSPKDYSTKYRY
jgi:hypothetical protein